MQNFSNKPLLIKYLVDRQFMKEISENLITLWANYAFQLRTKRCPANLNVFNDWIQAYAEIFSNTHKISREVTNDKK